MAFGGKGGNHIRVSRCKNKESWQWDYLLAKKLFSDDVLTRCVRWLGSHRRRKPMSSWHMKQPWLMPAAIREAAPESCILNMRYDRMVCRRWPWYTIIWATAQTLLVLTTSPIRVAAAEWWMLPALDCSWQCSWATPRSLKLLIFWSLTLWHSKIGSNFCGKSHV